MGSHGKSHFVTSRNGTSFKLNSGEVRGMYHSTNSVYVSGGHSGSRRKNPRTKRTWDFVLPRDVIKGETEVSSPLAYYITIREVGLSDADPKPLLICSDVEVARCDIVECPSVLFNGCWLIPHIVNATRTPDDIPIRVWFVHNWWPKEFAYKRPELLGNWVGHLYHSASTAQWTILWFCLFSVLR